MKDLMRRWWLLGVLAVALLAVRGLYAQPETAQPVIGEAVSVTASDADDEVVLEETAVDLPAALEPWVYLPVVIKPHAFSAEARSVLDIVNAERAQAGCGPVVLQTQLTAAAQGHSEDMAFQDYFSHTSKDGRSPWDRIHATGYQYTAAAENIAVGQASPESAMNSWMNSDKGHRENILNCTYTEMGLGYYYHSPDTGNVNYRHYWTQVFAKPR